MRMSVMAWAMLLTFVAAVPLASAQEMHTASPADLDAVLQQHASTSNADRDVVLGLLEREEVKKVAGAAGLDLRRAASAVAAFDGPELASLAAQARQVERSLAGGQSITISTTLIIIALLVIILIVVAVD